jgi:hypothetical protein
LQITSINADREPVTRWGAARGVASPDGPSVSEVHARDGLTHLPTEDTMSLIFSVIPRRFTVSPAPRGRASEPGWQTSEGRTVHKDSWRGGPGRCVFSTGAVDRQRNRINQQGWDLRAYRRVRQICPGRREQPEA